MRAYLESEAALEALNNDGRDVAHMKHAYEQRRNFMQTSFKEMGISTIPASGAFYAFVDISPFGMPAKDFALAL